MEGEKVDPYRLSSLSENRFAEKIILVSEFGISVHLRQKKTRPQINKDGELTYKLQVYLSVIVYYFPNVKRAEKPMAAGSKFISDTRFNSGFQSNEILSGMLANL